MLRGACCDFAKHEETRKWIREDPIWAFCAGGVCAVGRKGRVIPGLKIALLKEAAGYGFLAQADCCLLAELVVAFQNSSSRSESYSREKHI